jgi:hypothetical protein
MANATPRLLIDQNSRGVFPRFSPWSRDMEEFDKDAQKIEKFIWKKRPFLAKAKEEMKKDDDTLARYFPDDEWREFDRVVFSRRMKEVYCSFYDREAKAAVLIPVTSLKFQNIDIQKRVSKFAKKYFRFSA